MSDELRAFDSSLITHHSLLLFISRFLGEKPPRKCAHVCRLTACLTLHPQPEPHNARPGRLERVVRAFAAQVIRRRISHPIVMERQKARQPSALVAVQKPDDRLLMFSVL
jgi:hypothetical protein